MQRLILWRHVGALAFVFSVSCGDQVVVRETQAECGNGIVDSDEQCDDGNDSQLDDCTDGCLLARCGDGVTRTDLTAGDEGYEACDDGKVEEQDACLSG